MPSYNIYDYSISDLIRLFGLKTTAATLCRNDVQRAQQKIQLSEKNGILSAESLAFFHQALLKLNQELEQKQEKRPPTTEFACERKEKKQQQEFTAKFNNLFENAVQSKQMQERRQKRNGWFSSNDKEIPEIEKAKNIDDMHQRVEQMRSSCRSVNREAESVYTGSSCGRFYDEEDDDDTNDETANGAYISCNLFERALKFDDIRRVHRDQTIIPVKTVQQIPTISIEQYKSQRSGNIVPMDKRAATTFLTSLEQQIQQEWQRKHDKALDRMAQYSQQYKTGGNQGF